jgi:hypothetical protein
MAVSSPEVTVENIIQNGFADIIANASTYIPLILRAFPVEYQNFAISWLKDPAFKVNTLFGYAYDPSTIPPLFNIVLSNESEGTAAGRQMYLGDIVNAADENPNTEDYEEYGSMWTCAVSVIIRCEKARQAIILYSLIKWLFLKNRETLEAAGIKATKFSGGDLVYDASKQPAFAFTRQFKIDCQILNTWEVDVTSDPLVRQVISAFDHEVRDLENYQID